MREVVIVVFDGVQSLDLTGPLEVFHGAGRLAEHEGNTGYRVRVASRDGRPVTTSSGLRIAPDCDLASIRGRLDTVLVAGGDGTADALADTALIRWIARAPSRARRVGSVCSGAFLLAEAGLLDGRRATTHWASCRHLAERYPAVEVEDDPIFVRDGDIVTSAGVTAGMDLALALVEEDLGREAALTIARWLVLFLRRPANQAQFSAHLATQLADREGLREVQRFVIENPGAELSVEALAERAAMSPRHFARVFSAEVGITPARYVERIRLEAARRRLEESRDGVEVVAAACGFGTAETMRRTFLRSLGTSPTEYRRRFQPIQAA
jgi:transcriptional regulator GlxA family with amidase domain